MVFENCDGLFLKFIVSDTRTVKTLLMKMRWFFLLVLKIFRKGIVGGIAWG